MVKVSFDDDMFLLHASEQASCLEVLYAAAWISGDDRCVLSYSLPRSERLAPARDRVSDS